MKTKILYVVAFLLVLAAGFQIGRLSMRGEASTAPAEQTAAVAEEEEEEDYDDFEAYISNKYEGMDITGAEVFDYKGNPVSLASLTSPTTIFARYSNSGCRPCIDALLDALATSVAANPKLKVVILVKNMAMRDIYVYDKDLGENYSVYSADRLPLDFNQGETPYSFRVVDGKIKDHFTCRYGEPERTTDYITQLTTSL